MPTGIIINVLAVIIGGLIGSLVGDRIPEKIKLTLNMIFGLCAFCMGISSVVLMQNMPAVVFAVIIGTLIGVLLQLGLLIEKGAIGMKNIVAKFAKAPEGLSQAEFLSSLITIIILFSASSTGIYGSMVSGMSGDHSILIAKSILDFFTAMIFGCSLGMVVSVIAVPQFIVFMICFILARVILPLTTPVMISDFKACGGFLLIATGFKMLKLKEFPLAEMIPAMILVMPVSWFWVNILLPLINH